MTAERVYRIVYDRKACIGAAACAAVAPDFWKMAEDGKADLVKFELDDNGNQVLFVKESEMTPEGKKAIDVNRDAAEVCPVQAIHVYDADTNEKIV